MNIRIEINTDNDAFTDNESQETCRILHELIDRIYRYSHFSPDHCQLLRDYNGNTVGRFDILE